MADGGRLAVDTPLGYQEVVSRKRWRESVRFRHPALTGYFTKVIQRCQMLWNSQGCTMIALAIP